MDAPKFDKSKLPSRHVTEGPERAPHRSYYYAMGLSDAEIHQPFVGVATCWNEAAPCNIALNRQAQAVKLGVKQALGTPRDLGAYPGLLERHPSLVAGVLWRDLARRRDDVTVVVAKEAA